MSLAPDHDLLDKHYSRSNGGSSTSQVNSPIQAVTAYSPVLLSQAGYSSVKQNALAGGLNTIGTVGTIISATIVDKFGRRRSLMRGAAGLFAVNLIVRGLC